MRILWWNGALLLWLAGLPGLLVAQPGDWMSLQRRLVEIYEENKQSLVRVKAAYPADEGEAEPKPKVIIGTGFFISNRGLVLTNASIVYEPERVWIEHRGIAYAAEVVGSDQMSNLALLRIDTLPKEFGFLHLTDSPELPEIGGLVVRISMPLEFEATPELGLIAGYESRFGGRFFPCKYIRTTVDAGLGDGGAAYLDLSGRLIGMQVVSIPEVGSTYVLPARAALRLRDDFLFSGEIQYGWIGFEVREESSVENGKRLVLAKVMPGTPAEEVGLLADDVLLRIGDYPVRTVDDLRNAMFYARVGQYIGVHVRRGGERLEFSVRLAERPDDEPLQVIRPIEPARTPVSPMRSPSESEEGELRDPRFRASSRFPQEAERNDDVPLEKPE